MKVFGTFFFKSFSYSPDTGSCGRGVPAAYLASVILFRPYMYTSTSDTALLTVQVSGFVQISNFPLREKISIGGGQSYEISPPPTLSIPYALGLKPEMQTRMNHSFQKVGSIFKISQWKIFPLEIGRFLTLHDTGE